MRIAYDLDGVLCPLLKRSKSIFKQTGEERKDYNKVAKDHFRNAKCLLKPSGKFFIITGRGKREELATNEWLMKNKIRPEKICYLYEKLTHKSLAKHKIQWLRDLKIDVFYEDDEKIVEKVREELPNIKCIHIPRTEKNVIIH